MPAYEGISEKQAVVLEFGHSFTKAGFAGENSPRCILPTAVRSKENPDVWKRIYDYKDENDLYQMLVEFLHQLYFKHLLVTPKDRKMVIVESLFAVTQFRCVLARVLYLHYEILNVMWLPCHLAAVCASGTDTALVVDVGYEEAVVIPVISGVTLLSNLQTYELGAKDFDKNLALLLQEHCIIDAEKKENAMELLDASTVENIRVRTCFVTRSDRAEKLAENKVEELNPKLKPFTYEVNGESFLEFEGIVREKAAEFWFQNDELDGISLPSMILDVLTKCPIDSKAILSKSILLAGGTTMLPGFKARLVRDLKKVVSENYKERLSDSLEFRFFDLPIKENCVNWIGGAIYGSSEAVSLRGVSKEFYLKTGQIPDWSNPDFKLVSSMTISGFSASMSPSSFAKSL